MYKPTFPQPKGCLWRYSWDSAFFCPLVNPHFWLHPPLPRPPLPHQDPTQSQAASRHQAHFLPGHHFIATTLPTISTLFASHISDYILEVSSLRPYFSYLPCDLVRDTLSSYPPLGRLKKMLTFFRKKRKKKKICKALDCPEEPKSTCKQDSSWMAHLLGHLKLCPLKTSRGTRVFLVLIMLL